MRHPNVLLLFLMWFGSLASHTEAVEYDVVGLGRVDCSLACTITSDINDLGHILFQYDVVFGNRLLISNGINNSGDIVGADITTSQAFVFSKGTFSNFAVPGAVVTDARRINNRGDIVGYAMFGSVPFTVFGFVRTAEGELELFQYPGATATFGYFINDRRQVIGTFNTSNGTGGSFLMDGTSFRQLGPPKSIRDRFPGWDSFCRVRGMNNQEQVLGVCSFGGAGVFAYVRHGLEDDAPVDVLDFAPGTEGTSINNLGHVLGTRDFYEENFLATPRPGLFAAVLPSSRSSEVGTTTTALVAVLNASQVPARNVELKLRQHVPALLSYQPLDAPHNTGPLKTSNDIPPGATQVFVISLAPINPFPSTELSFSISSNTTNPAPVSIGTNTLLMAASSMPGPDIVAIGATVANNGIVDIPGTNGTGFFSVAAVNVGASATITATADTGSVTLPVRLTVCQTDPSAGVCINPPNPAASATVQIGGGQTRTFAVFVQSSDVIPFSPGINRAFVRFNNQAGVTVGAWSVALRTQQVW